MSAPALQITGLSRSYGPRRVLSDVSLVLEPGECLVLTGPAGSGRSALIRCLTRGEDSGEGAITLGGVPLPRGGPELVRMRQRLGVVWPEAVLFPHLSVLGNCAWALMRGCGLPQDEAEAVAQAALARVGMAGRDADRPAQLTLGEARRVAIARAMALGPEVMLLDDPTAGLDRTGLGEVRATVADLARRKVTMICATDDIPLARRIADRVVYMEGGRVIETAPASGFFAGPSSARAREFLDRARALSGDDSPAVRG